MPNNSDNKQTKDATLNDVVDALVRNQEKLEEVSMWLKITGSDKVKTILTSTLNTPEKIMVYHLSDGKTTREIATNSGVSISTISTYWKNWNKLGLMKSIRVSGGERYMRNFDLDDCGIEIPKIISKQETVSTVTTLEETKIEDQHNAV